MTSVPRARATAMTLASFAWYPCLLALTWGLQFVTRAEIAPVSAYRSLVVLGVLAIAITVTVRVIVSNAYVAGAIACIVVLGLLKATSLPAVVVFAAGVALLLLEFQMESRGRLRLPWLRIHEVLTVLAAAILAVQVTSYGLALRGRPMVAYDPAWVAELQAPAARPNVYVVIADAHGRADVLKDAYDYDPAPFVATLEGLDFEVSRSSRANYLKTSESLASFFAGDHLEHMGLDMTRQPDPAFLASALEGSPALAMLRRLGYEDIEVPSGYDHVAERAVDANLDTGQLSDLEYRLLQSSQLDVWIPRQIEDWWLDAARSRTEASLARLGAIAAEGDERPRVVVAHLPLPHLPYLFDTQCGRRGIDRFTFQGIDPDGRDEPQMAAIAGQQTRCVDGMLATTLATVVAADPTAVVILMSDHGPDVRLDWHAPAEPGLTDRSGNFFAARTPGHPGLFPDDITLVNVLPRLFNAYFGTALPPRADEVYISAPSPDSALVNVHDVMPRGAGSVTSDPLPCSPTCSSRR